MKKAITLALVLVLALSLLTACGGNDNGGGSTTTPPANNSTTNPPSSTPPASQGGNETTPSNNGVSVEWPDNEFTQQIPKSDAPLFDVLGPSSLMEGMPENMNLMFRSDDAEMQCRDYIEQLQGAGFTLPGDGANAAVKDDPGNEKGEDRGVSYKAYNDSGWLVQVSWSSVGPYNQYANEWSIMITEPKK
jgi:hypothetical protein